MSSDHAVVVGGSFAGIAAARVLSDHFERVTIIERDEIPTEPTVRKGVPQGAHVHGILKIGRDILDKLFPGFVAETQSEGAVLFDLVAESAGFGSHGWLARGPSSVRGFGIRRPLLEDVARRRVLALPNVELVRGRVEDLVVSHQLVEGVVAHTDLGRTTYLGDLVVDAGGRGSGASRWLERAGFEVPTETVVNGFGGYASRWLRVPDDAWPAEGLRSIANLPCPKNTKGAILYPQDNGLHIISLFGQSRDYPPSDEVAFDAFLSQLETPLIHQVVSRSEEVSEIRTSRSTSNYWRNFEELQNPPAGFVVLGAAASHFNPMAGQGISATLLDAVILGETIADHEGDRDALPGAFQSRQADQMKFPWSVAVGFDLQFPETSGERPEPSPQGAEDARYMDVLSQVATVDPRVVEALMLANQTFDRSGLRRPDVVSRVAAWSDEGSPLPNTDPTRIPVLALESNQPGRDFDPMLTPQ